MGCGRDTTEWLCGASKVNLYLFGINHFDPMCRTKLVAALEHLRDTLPTRPAFVAVEWDSDLFTRVKAKRPTFRHLLCEEWPQAPPQLVDQLVLTLGYEGDTQALVFPEADVLWLEEGRAFDVSDFAEARLKVYKDFLGTSQLPAGVSAALALLSEAAWQGSREPTTGTERDDKWTRLILDKIQGCEGRWAPIIVGRNHVINNDRYLRRQLEDAGLTCQVCILQ